MYAGSKAIFYALSRSAVLKRLASQHGLATPTSFASRFIAGETIETAIEASSRLQSQGLLVTLDYLGERVRTMEESAAAALGYVRLLEAIGWLVYADGAFAPSSMRSHALGLRIEPGGSHAGLVQRSTIPALVITVEWVRGLRFLDASCDGSVPCSAVLRHRLRRDSSDSKCC